MSEDDDGDAFSLLGRRPNALLRDPCEKPYVRIVKFVYAFIGLVDLDFLEGSKLRANERPGDAHVPIKWFGNLNDFVKIFFSKKRVN